MARAGRKALLLAAVAVLCSGVAAATGVAAQAAPAVHPVSSDVNPSSTSNAFYGVSAVSPDDAWAVGLYRSNGNGNTETLTAHWNGTAWSLVPSPSPGIDGNGLLGVTAISPTDAWAVGSYSDSPAVGTGRTLILHWNGNVWTRVPSPDPNQPLSELWGVSAGSATDVWAVGQSGNLGTGEWNTLALHWNGTAWAKVPSPDPSSSPASVNKLYGVSAVSPAQAWAVGVYNYGHLSFPRPLILQWNGKAWSQAATPPVSRTNNVLYGASDAAGTQPWAVGSYFHGSAGPWRTLALRESGTTWSQVPSPSTDQTWNVLYGVSADSATDAWAAGYVEPANGYGARTLILHWNGTTWSREQSPDPSLVLNVPRSVSADSPTDAWAVGVYDTNRDQLGRTLILHWNGTTWSRS
jgi:hypothetical protein